MILFDSHCHLDDRSFDGHLHDVMDRARAGGVRGFLTVGINRASSEKCVSIAASYAGVYASVGVHPHDAKTCSPAVLDRLQRLAGHSRVRAWGEIGLDFNRMFSSREDQENAVIRQLKIAGALGLPVIFHERDSQGHLLDILTAYAPPELQGVVHCFTGTEADMHRYLAMGLYIGITGIVTIRKRGESLRRLVSQLPADRILVETDAPYLTPTPERNRCRRNEPAFVKTVLMKLAEVRGDDLEVLAKQVWENSCRLFGIDPLELDNGTGTRDGFKFPGPDASVCR